MKKIFKRYRTWRRHRAAEQAYLRQVRYHASFFPFLLLTAALFYHILSGLSAKRVDLFEIFTLMTAVALFFICRRIFNGIVPYPRSILHAHLAEGSGKRAQRDRILIYSIESVLLSAICTFLACVIVSGACTVTGQPLSELIFWGLFGSGLNLFLFAVVCFVSFFVVCFGVDAALGEYDVRRYAAMQESTAIAGKPSR